MEFGGGIIEQFRDKCILVTGSTGFLAKIFVEKVLRVQPNVKKLFLLVRASDANSAMQRLQNEVIDKQLFDGLREKHGNEFPSFITNRLTPIPGDIALESLGIRDTELMQELLMKVDIILSAAATTKFYERYDVALQTNVLGAKHVVEFAKDCKQLEMILHVSTAYVAGKQEGMVVEKPFSMGETLKGNLCLEIEEELRLVKELKVELSVQNLPNEVEKSAMKELGLKRAKNFGWPNTYVFTKAMGEMILGHLRGSIPLVILRPTIITSIRKEPFPGWTEGTRTIDTGIVGILKGNLPCFLLDREAILDTIPGDMVVNAIIVAMASHSNQRFQFIYHICSSKKNPATYSVLEDGMNAYFDKHPLIGKNGKNIKRQNIQVFRTKASFSMYMALRYRMPLEALKVVNFALCGLFSLQYKPLNYKYKFGMLLAELYEPYTFSKSRFDDSNAEKLRMNMVKANSDEEAMLLDFNPENINWEEYFSLVHIPGVVKFLCK